MRSVRIVVFALIIKSDIEKKDAQGSRIKQKLRHQTPHCWFHTYNIITIATLLSIYEEFNT